MRYVIVRLYIYRYYIDYTYIDIIFRHSVSSTGIIGYNFYNVLVTIYSNNIYVEKPHDQV